MISGIIYSTDNSYVNNVRSKCLQKGLELEHLESITKIVSYMIIHKRGIVLLDLRHPSKIISLIYENFIKTGYLDFKFIYLNDFSENNNIEIDDINSFATMASNLDTILDNISSNNSKFTKVNALGENEILDEITNSLIAFNLPTTMKGFDYLKECVYHKIRRCDVSMSISDIYSIVADTFGEDISNIEKCVRVAVRNMASTSNQAFKSVFGELRVTAKIFVSLLSNYIINKL